jgi:S-disulfanyl-L-cysteine oxidoreductase SoxD
MLYPLACRVLGLVLTLGLATETLAQSPPTSVLDAVYSNAQAQRGSRTYRNVCAHCHEGGEPDADPLFGGEFIERWREAPLSFLHGFFSAKMPADEPGTLSAAVYLETLAFLLKENGYPAGSTELKAEQLDSILFTGPDGPQPLPANSLVRLVGCLAADETGGEHNLVQAAMPVRVRNADDSNAEELALSAASAAGSFTYQLRNAGRFAAAGAVGQRVQAKGVFNPQGTRPSLNVLSLESLGQTCE